MRVVLQLERIGDLVQSLPAIDLVGRDREPAVLLVQESVLPFAQELIEEKACDLRAVPADRMQRLLASLRPGVHPEDLSAAIRDLVVALRLPAVSQVVNLTWHPVGAHIASAIDARQRWGPVLDDDGHVVCRGFWARYPIVAVDAFPAGRVHMQDVRRLLVEECSNVSRASVATRMRAMRDGPVALVVGASDPKRIWPVESQVKLAQSLSQLGERIVLVGGIRESALARQIESSCAGAVENQVGKLGPAALSRRLREAKLVVGGDTGPTHLACHHKTPVVMIMAGRAHVWETGPTSQGSIAIQALPEGASDPASIPVEAVTDSVVALLSGAAPSCTGRGFRIVRTHLAGDEDGIGGVVYDGEAGPSRMTRLLLSGVATDGEWEPDLPALTRLMSLASEASPDLESSLARAREQAALGREQADDAARALKNRDPAAAGQALRLAGDTMSRIAGALLGAPETRLVGVALQLQIDEIEGRTPVAVVQELRRLFRRTESALTGAHAIASRLHVGAGSDART